MSREVLEGGAGLEGRVGVTINAELDGFEEKGMEVDAAPVTRLAAGA